MGERIVLDLETQREFSEVEGRKPELLGVSLVGIYRYSTDTYEAYLESEIPTLAPLLQQAELLIGFNIKRFDLPVLSPYLKFPIANLPVLDLLEEVVKGVGHRLSLDSLSTATLGRGKGGSGLDALKWYKEGKFDLIKEYCLKDVQLTKDIYEYGKQHGRLFATSRFNNEKIQVPVFWPDRKRDMAGITKLLQEAYAKRLQVELDYWAFNARGGEPARQTRKVDIYYVREPHFEGFCHLRNDLRQFQMDRVLDIKPTWQRYTVPAGYVPAAIPK